MIRPLPVDVFDVSIPCSDTIGFTFSVLFLSTVFISPLSLFALLFPFARQGTWTHLPEPPSRGCLRARAVRTKKQRGVLGSIELPPRGGKAVDLLPEIRRGFRGRGCRRHVESQDNPGTTSLVHEVASYLGAAFSYDEMDIKILELELL